MGVMVVPLTDVAIRKALKLPHRQKLADGAGMYLLIDPPRSPGWRLKYRIARHEKLLSLGVYPLVTLSRAREKREDARRLISDGVDPSAERKAERAAKSDTFRLVAEDWLARQSKVLAPETISIMQGRLTSTLFPAFGNRPLSEIKAADLLAVLRRIEAKGTHETAHRVRALYGRVARFGIAEGKAERDVSADLRDALTPVDTEHYPAITEPRRIGELLRAIDTYVGQPSVEFALKLAPYVFVRPGELRGAAWREFNLEGNEPEWRIPGARMKMDREHIVPLATQVVKLLRELHVLTGDGDILFPGLRTASRPISNNSLNAALRRLDFSQDEMTGHGFRTMASTLLNEQHTANGLRRFSGDWIEKQLAHQEKDATRDAYNAAEYLPQRRKMMQWWANHLDGFKAAK